MEEERDIEFAVLENMMNSTIELAREYNQCRIIVCKNESGNLILATDLFYTRLLMDTAFFRYILTSLSVSLKRLAKIIHTLIIPTIK